jgi:hypothetical protein
MTRLNYEQFLSVNQPVTSIGTTASTNVFNTKASRDIWTFEVPIEVKVDTTFASSGAGTLTVRITTSSDNSTFTDLVKTKTYPYSELVVGKRLFSGMLPQGVKQYLRVEYDVGTAVMTAGTVTAHLPDGLEESRNVVGFTPIP